MAALSIIIATYNSEKTIANAIDSITIQKFQNFELLIIDGLSTDRTLSIVKSYNDSRIHVSSEKDRGIYDAMNKGIQLAKGEWLFFLGSDDVLIHKNILDLIYNTKASSMCDLIYGKVIFKNSKHIYGKEMTYLEMMQKQMNIPHQAIFYSKSIFKKIGLYDLAFPIYADFDLNLKCFKNESIRKVFVDEIVSVFNETGSSEFGRTKDHFYDIIAEEYVNTIATPLEIFNQAKELHLENDSLKSQIKIMQSSGSYRLGQLLVSPFKMLKGVLKDIKKKYHK